MAEEKSLNQQLSELLDTTDLTPEHRRFIGSTYETCLGFSRGVTRSFFNDSGLDSPIVVINVSCSLEIEIAPFLPFDQLIDMLGINQGQGLTLISAEQDQTKAGKIQRLCFSLPTKAPRDERPSEA